jgi:tRNA modification GTPase
LALHGPLAWQIVRGLAQRTLPDHPEPGCFWLTRLGDKARGEVDDVVVAVKQTAPEQVLELHCHGGREIVCLLTELLETRGAKVCCWQDIGLGFQGASWPAAALAVLLRTTTVRTAAIALDQCHSALAHTIAAVAADLERGDAAHAMELLTTLMRYAPVGSHLAVPWRVVIAGATNVGKSSLVNALAGFQRSIVSPVPGTTRDVVTTLLALDGWPVEVADTAGWRSTDAPVEREGIGRAQAALESADLCLWLLDATAPPVWPDANLAKVQIVINKIDLAPAWPLDSVQAPRVSALTGAGMPELCQALAGWLVAAVPPPGAAVPYTAEIAAALAEVTTIVEANQMPEALGKLAKLYQ